MIAFVVPGHPIPCPSLPRPRRVGAHTCRTVEARRSALGGYPAADTTKELQVAVATAAAASIILGVVTCGEGRPALAANRADIPPVQAGCFNGEGSACEDLAGGSGLIQRLQERSREHKEENFLKMREQYWQQGYTDYFMFGYNKKLVVNPDGSYSLQDP
mmetsp:Transcript_11973/g.24382  ORF Transcript_11973/g.24382 Transcript_11973/m.24382 type:complete len:160 (+) Transcript_11973:1940-2419(+)